MTRPGIVRADTLDLQDQENPSAQDHSRSGPQHLEFGDQLIGAHQAQEIRHVGRERQEEEHNLQQAWSAAATDGGNSDIMMADDGRISDTEGESASDDDMMDRISSSPSISDEDIDFDFVYALHTFVATVEGQANATKGDTMVLLDDSNSYWWLVRIVKDSSIGYLPAEHIETPTERLARLNKHRNVDLSAAMLGDNAERKKNPLKKAMKRRGAKNVTFGEPSANTYVEASDYDYSSDEDEGISESRNGSLTAGENGTSQQQQNHQEPQQQASQQSQAHAQSQSAAAVVSSSEQKAASQEVANSKSITVDSQAVIESPPTSPKLQERAEGAPLRASRKGTPRNADSFLKDDTAETRIFTLTPNLLRDEGPRIREVTGNRAEGADPFMSDKESAKEDKRKKEKKQRTFSGLFKSRRKEKEKDKGKKDHVSDNDERASSDTARSVTTISADTSPNLREMERKSSQKGRKLQKSSASSSVVSTPQTLSPNLARSSSFPNAVELEGSPVIHEAPTGLEDEIRVIRPVNNEKQAGVPSHITNGVETDADGHTRNGSFMHGTEAPHIPSQSDEYVSKEEEQMQAEMAARAAEERESNSSPSSVAEIIPNDDQEPESKVKPVEAEKLDDDRTPVPSKPQSPHPELETAQTVPVTPQRAASASGDSSSLDPQRQDSKSSLASSRGGLSPSPASTNATQWSDAGLLAWADGDNDIKDMLTMIYDTSEVKPDPNHPWVKDLFKEEQEKLDTLSRELDGLLHGYLARRGAARQVQVPAG